MKQDTLFLLLSITILFSFVNGSQELSSFVTKTDLGAIKLTHGRVTGWRILDAFVNANPGLPEDLRSTLPGDRLLYLVKQSQNGATIGVNILGSEQYKGEVQVTFNTDAPAPA